MTAIIRSSRHATMLAIDVWVVYFKLPNTFWGDQILKGLWKNVLGKMFGILKWK